MNKFTQEQTTQNLKDVPVTLFIAVTIIIIFALYATSAIKSLPCGKDVMSSFYSNFVHIDIYHLMANLFALYALSRIEKSIGAKSFIGIVVFLLIFNTLIEVAANKLISKLPCSIGFSGVLFGIMTWELVTSRKLDGVLLVSIVMMVVLPSIQNPKASLMGHAVGAVAGVVGGLIWNKLAPLLKLNSKPTQ